MKKLKFIMSAVMLTACISAFIGAGGATAFAYEGEEPAIECEHEYTEEMFTDLLAVLREKNKEETDGNSSTYVSASDSMSGVECI